MNLSRDISWEDQDVKQRELTVCKDEVKYNRYGPIQAGKNREQEGKEGNRNHASGDDLIDELQATSST